MADAAPPADDGKTDIAAEELADTTPPVRLVGAGIIVVALSIGLVLEKLLGDVFGVFRLNNAELVGNWTLASAVAYAAVVAGAAVFWMNEKSRTLAFEIAGELRRVTWPTFEQARSSTTAVIVFSLVCSVVMGGFDFIASKVMTQWIPDLLGWLSRGV